MEVQYLALSPGHSPSLSSYPCQEICYCMVMRAHIMKNLVSLVAVDGVDLVTIVDGMVAELVLNGRELGAGLEGQKAKTKQVFASSTIPNLTASSTLTSAASMGLLLGEWPFLLIALCGENTKHALCAQEGHR